MTAPCKNCPDRTIEPNCHTTCKKYLEWRKFVDETRQKEIAYKQIFIPIPHP